MARRAALIALVAGLVSCGSSNGSNDDWTCVWACHSSVPPTSGTATYPNGTNLNQQCQADHGPDCSSFECNCTQN
jgi:hypothetical protein